MNTQGSWRELYHQMLQQPSCPAEVDDSIWQAFITDIIKTCADARQEDLIDADFQDLVAATDTEPEEIAYRAVLQALKLLFTDDVQTEALTDVRRSFASDRPKTEVELWGHLVWALYGHYSWEVAAPSDEAVRDSHYGHLLLDILPADTARATRELMGWDEFDEDD